MDHQQQCVRTELAEVMPDAARISAILKDCLLLDSEAESATASDYVLAEGINMSIGFHRERLAGHTQEIVDELADLPEPFRIDKGGWSFLNGCIDKDGNQWGEQFNVQELMLLGLAAGKVTYLLPRQHWDRLPGGMPYFAVHD